MTWGTVGVAQQSRYTPSARPGSSPAPAQNGLLPCWRPFQQPTEAAPPGVARPDPALSPRVRHLSLETFGSPPKAALPGSASMDGGLRPELRRGPAGSLTPSTPPPPGHYTPLGAAAHISTEPRPVGRHNRSSSQPLLRSAAAAVRPEAPQPRRLSELVPGVVHSGVPAVARTFTRRSHSQPLTTAKRSFSGKSALPGRSATPQLIITDSSVPVWRAVPPDLEPLPGAPRVVPEHRPLPG
eukprot:EG_transcript_26230